MSGKIIDATAVAVTVTIGPSETETVLVTSGPQKVGSVARINWAVAATQDSTQRVRRGSGTAGDILYGGGNASGLIVDDTPVAQYTITAVGDNSTTGESAVYLTVDQIA